jgi:hypothetical protein
MLQFRPGAGFFLNLFKIPNVGKGYFPEPPEIKKVNYHRDYQQEKCIQKVGVNKPQIRHRSKAAMIQPHKDTKKVRLTLLTSGCAIII